MNMQPRIPKILNDGEKMESKNSLENELGEILNYKAKDDKTIGEHNQDLIDRADVLFELGYINDAIYKLLCAACKYHDLGKANPEFAKRIDNKKLKFNPDKEVPHNILSMNFIPKEHYSEREYLILLFAVGFHHNYGDVFEYLESEEKRKLSAELLKKWKSAKILGRVAAKNISYNRIYEKNEAILIKGLLHKCDYAASGNTEIEYKNDFLEAKLQAFFRNFHYDMNDMQRFCLDNHMNDIMVVGQTGLGKTEASLLWLGNHKGFIFLPVRTAINKMYDRIRDSILKCEDYSSAAINHQLGLLHSDAVSKLINSMSQREEKNRNDIVKVSYDNKACEENVLECYRQSRQLAMPITVSTIDQLFDFVFKYYGYELKLATLAYSKIIIDEIQMYGPDLLADLIWGLKQIKELGGKIAITTATLAPYVRDLIETEIGHFEYREFCNDKQVRHKIKLNHYELNADDVMEKYQECVDLGEKKKILVICNSIKKAQEMYDSITKTVGADEVKLLHSRFTKGHRKIKEDEICLCGKFENQERIIWISTSLVEASLDIDFDYLFTEIQDISSLFQRLGRVNRQGKKKIEYFNCFIYTEINKALFDDMQYGFIDREIFELSKKALINETDEDGDLSEGAKMNILRKYFTMEDIKRTNYFQKYQEQIRQLKQIRLYNLEKDKVKMRADIHTCDVIPGNLYEEHLEEINEAIDRIKNSGCDLLTKIKEREKIMQYSVSVPQYYESNYRNAIKNNLGAVKYDEIQLDMYDRIPVIDCYYDYNRGLIKKNFKGETVDPLML